MALPVSFSGVEVGDQNSYHGPFKSSGGNFYTVLEHTTTSDLSAWKATDPTSSFTEQDTTNRPSLSIITNSSIWAFQKSDNIHCAVQIGPASFDLYYSRFDMSTDTWADPASDSTQRVLIDSAPAGDDSPNASACSIAVEETGSDIVIAYQGESSKDMGAEYATIHYAKSTDNGVNWSSGNVVADTNNIGETHFTGPVIVRGSSDRMHIFFNEEDFPQDKVYQRTLRSDDSLETFPTSFASVGDTPVYQFGKGISYDSGGTQKVRVPNGDFVVSLDSADTPSVSRANAGDQGVAIVNNGFVSCMAVNGTDEHLMYAHNASSDLFRDVNTGSGWGTDTEVLDAVTINHVSANIYDRSGTKLAYVYDDGGTVKYNEVDLGGGGETQITIAATAQGTAALTLTRPLRNITIDSTAQGTAALSVRKVLSSITLAANAVGTAALTRTANFFRDLSATAQGTATIARTTFIIRTLAATAQGTAALTKTVTFKRTLAVTAQGTAALTKMMTLFRTLAATAQATAALTVNELAGVTQITIAAIAQGSAALTSRIALRHLDISATAQATADLVRQVFFFRTLSAIAQGTANLTKQTLVVKILAAVAQGTANLTKQMTLFRPLSAIAQGTAALTKQMTLFRTLAATAQGTATLVSQKIFVITLAAVASVTAAVSTVITSLPIPFSGHGGLGMMDGLTRWSRRRRTWTRRR